MARTPRNPLPPPPARKGRGGRVLGTLSLLALGTFGMGAGYLLRNPTLRRYVFSYGTHLFRHQTPAEVFPDTPHAMNLMVIGRDYDYTDKDQIIKSHARSDMLMVAHLDFDRKTVSLLSIPRDTRAEIPGHGVAKINAAHAYGGPALSEKTVEVNFGIPSDKYIALDFQGFEKAIDLLGGVDLTVDKQMDYDDNWGHLHIHLKPGYQHLNGEQAMGFVRFRHSDSDFTRIQRQQALLAALKAKLRRPDILAKVGPILTAIDTHTDTDLTTDQEVVLGGFLHDTPHGQIKMATLPSLDSSSILVPTDWAKATPMIQSIFDVTPPQEMLAEGGRHHRHHHRRRLRVAALP
ncbi:MAG: LCP family protein [Armatimonadetes bacterium]|nr:LCP family protein [Armatimonadota bacterium]